ncbi:hypothetical protein ACFX13_010684 [Malus domestica]
MQTDMSRIALRPFRLSDADDVLSFGGDDRHKADMGYALAARCWGQGITTKAVKIALSQVFKDYPDLVRLQSFVAVENKASQRVLEKVGFQREGVLRKYLYLKGDIKDMVVYSFLSSDLTNDLSSNELSRDESRP